MEDYHRIEQDLFFGVLDALPCPVALLNKEGQAAYINNKASVLHLETFDLGAIAQVRDCLRESAPCSGWVELRAAAPGGSAVAERVSGFAEAYPVRVDDELLGALFMLRPSVGISESYDSLPYASAVMMSLRSRLTRLCAIGVPALFLGEKGVGRADFARLLHDMSKPGEPFVRVSCRVSDTDILEQELFGDIPRPGALRALQGTVFLSDADTLPLSFQRRLLTLLHSRAFPDGMPFLARLSASGPPDLKESAETGEFDAALYARLAVMPVTIPPLRERPEDIIPLARCFLSRYAALTDAPARNYTDKALETLLTYSWPGNVKELEDAVVAALSRCLEGEIKPQHLAIEGGGKRQDLHEQRQGFTKRRIEEALSLYGHTVEGKRRAAKELGIGLSTLYRLMGEKKTD